MRAALSDSRVLVGAIMASALLAACGDAPSSGSSDLMSPEWSVMPDPVATVGLDEADPAQIFTRVSRGRLLRDGGFVILDRQAQELRAFSESGAHLWTVGGRGGGPSEFGYATDLGVMVDGSITVPDLGASKVATFSATGEFIGSRSILVDRSEWAGPLHSPMSSGTIPTMGVESISTQPTQSISFSESTLRVVLIRSDSAEPVVSSPGAQGFQRVEGPQLRGGSLPFGALVALDSGKDILVIGNGHLSPLVIDEAGDTTRIPSPFLHLAVTDQLKDDYLAAREDDRDLLLDVFATSAIPDSTPSYDRLWIDAEDRIWVRRYNVRPATHDWAVLGRGGAVLGRLQLPLDAEFLDADADHLLVRRETELDVQYVELYRLDDGAAQAPSI